MSVLVNKITNLYSNHSQPFSFIKLDNIHESTNENTFDPDITALHISPDEIACLASAKVPEGSSDECEALAQDLWSYGRRHPVPAIFISKKTAAEYLQSLEGQAGVINCHLESAKITIGSESIMWQRTDHRVSKEKLNAKFYLNSRNEKLSVQHEPTGNDSKSKYRIDCSFNKIMGMELTSDGVLTADVFGSPCVEKRSGSSRVWEAITSTNSSRSSRLVIVFHHHKFPESLQSSLEKIPSLCSALCTGLCNDYSNFDPTEGETPHDRLPLVRDPTLVRAAQLAILKLRDHASYETENIMQPRVQQIVEAFGGIEKRFQNLLKSRLIQKCHSAVQHQHEE